MSDRDPRKGKAPAKQQPKRGRGMTFDPYRRSRGIVIHDRSDTPRSHARSEGPPRSPPQTHYTGRVMSAPVDSVMIPTPGFIPVSRPPTHHSHIDTDETQAGSPIEGWGDEGVDDIDVDQEEDEDEVVDRAPDGRPIIRPISNG